MEFKLRIKPRHFKGCNKNDIMYQISDGHCWTYGLHKGSRINGLSPLFRKKDNYVRVFNLIKHNRKSIRTIDKKGNKHTTIKPMYWEAFVYDIPIVFFEISGLSVIQEKRNFRIFNRNKKS